MIVAIINAEKIKVFFGISSFQLEVTRTGSNTIVLYHENRNQSMARIGLEKTNPRNIKDVR